MTSCGSDLEVFSLSSFGGEGWGEEAVSLIVKAKVSPSPPLEERAGERRPLVSS